MIESKQDLAYYLGQDKIALYIPPKQRAPRPFYDEEWRYEIILRKLEYVLNCRTGKLFLPLRLFWKLRLHRYSVKLGIMVPPNVFGPGLSIAHRGTLGANGSAKIGRNCRIHEGVIIGASNGPEAAVIGDNVFLGTGAKVIGAVTLADNIVVGAGAVVVKSCLEPGVTLAGNPARIISHNDSRDFIAKGLDGAYTGEKGGVEA